MGCGVGANNDSMAVVFSLGLNAHHCLPRVRAVGLRWKPLTRDPTRPGRFWPGYPTRSLCVLSWEIILTTVMLLPCHGAALLDPCVWFYRHWNKLQKPGQTLSHWPVARPDPAKIADPWPEDPVLTLLWVSKNGPDPFPGRMSYKTTKRIFSLSVLAGPSVYLEWATLTVFSYFVFFLSIVLVGLSVPITGKTCIWNNLFKSALTHPTKTAFHG